MWIKEKQCGINITEHVLQLQRVITWYRNVCYREVSLYELHPFFLSCFLYLPQVDCISAEGAKDARKATDVQQKPETGWKSIGRDSRHLHWVFSENSPKKQISFSRWSFQSVWVQTFLVIAPLPGPLSVYIWSLFYLFRGKIVRILFENCRW